MTFVGEDAAEMGSSPKEYTTQGRARGETNLGGVGPLVGGHRGNGGGFGGGGAGKLSDRQPREATSGPRGSTTENGNGGGISEPVREMKKIGFWFLC